MTLSFAGRLYPLIVAVLLVLAGGAVADAGIPSGGVISACYNTRNGQLRVIDKDAGATCQPNEAPLSWNQAPEVWHGFGIGGDVPGDANGLITQQEDWTLATLATLSLPAGKFFIAAKTSLATKSDSPPSIFFCTLERPSPPRRIIDFSVDFGTTNNPLTVPLQGTVILSVPEEITLKCGSSSDSFAILPKIDAIRAGFVHCEPQTACPQ